MNYELRITLESDCLPGSGTGYGASIDLDSTEDADGFPTIPARRVSARPRNREREQRSIFVWSKEPRRRRSILRRSDSDAAPGEKACCALALFLRSALAGTAGSNWGLLYEFLCDQYDLTPDLDYAAQLDELNSAPDRMHLDVGSVKDRLCKLKEAVGAHCVDIVAVITLVEAILAYCVRITKIDKETIRPALSYTRSTNSDAGNFRERYNTIRKLRNKLAHAAPLSKKELEKLRMYIKSFYSTYKNRFKEIPENEQALQDALRETLNGAAKNRALPAEDDIDG